MIPEHTEELMTEKEVAQFLKVSVNTLRNYRSLGIGPLFVKLGRSVRYRMADVLAWVNGKGGGTVAALLAGWLMDYS